MSDDKDTNQAEIDPDEAIADAWAAALEEQKESEQRETHSGMEGIRRMSPEDFSGFQPTPASEVNLNMVLDVPVTIAMEIGRTKIPIRNLLQLNQGSVVELDRLAGEPLDVLVNGTLIAHGEVVVVNEKFGIRLTDVISPSERVRKLR